jgi:diguanylate cyclase (GGDEF)-like protein
MTNAHARMSKPLVCLNYQRGSFSLRALLLLFTGVLLVAVLLASMGASYGYFRQYVSSQLAGHAQDGATAVGLSLSNAIDGRDPVASSSLIDAVFDSGRYLSVEYLDHSGTVVAGRRTGLSKADAPTWFIHFADLPTPVATAQVVRGWQRLGLVNVVSHPGRAYRDLWRIAVALVLSAAVISGIGLLCLWLLLRQTLQPLNALERQAEAIGRREFRQRIRVAGTRELRQVTVAMNTMADQLEKLFYGQARLIQQLRKFNNEDPVTGLASLTAFDQRLKVEVQSEERAAPGVLLIFQLSQFAKFNMSLGRQEGDRLLARLAKIIEHFTSQHADAFAGRRMGASFVLYFPGVSSDDALPWCQSLLADIDDAYSAIANPLAVAVHGGLAPTVDGAGVPELLIAAESALRQAQSQSESGCRLLVPDSGAQLGAEAWRVTLQEALALKRFALWLQPVMSCAELVHGEPLYHQVFSRINTADGALKAALFVPMAEHLGLIAAIDRQLVHSVLAHLRLRPQMPLAISLGNASVKDPKFQQDLLAELKAAGAVARHLWVGISELAIHRHREAATRLVQSLNDLQVSVVVDRFGVGGVPFSYLKNLRLEALRIDNSFTHGIDEHGDNRFFLKSVVDIAHSRGVKVFASGVETVEEFEVLCNLGIDGAMGYHLGRPFTADNHQLTGE